MKTLKRHLTVANVLSITALFIALGGSAFAAMKLQPGQVKSVNLANRAVTNSKIKTQAVTSGKIKNNGIVTADLANGSVRGGKVANGGIGAGKLGKESVLNSNIAKKAVTESKLGAEAVTTGKLANEAVTSAKISIGTWRQLLKNVTYVTVTSGPQENVAKTMVALCPSGKEAIGGGFRVTGVNDDVIANESAPEFNVAGARIGWSASARDLETKSGSWTLLAYAVCAEL